MLGAELTRVVHFAEDVFNEKVLIRFGVVKIAVHSERFLVTGFWVELSRKWRVGHLRNTVRKSLIPIF